MDAQILATVAIVAGVWNSRAGHRDILSHAVPSSFDRDYGPSRDVEFWRAGRSPNQLKPTGTRPTLWIAPLVLTGILCAVLALV